MITFDLRGIRNNYTPGDELLKHLPIDPHRDVIFDTCKGEVVGNAARLSLTALKKVKRYQSHGFHVAVEYNNIYYPVEV